MKTLTVKLIEKLSRKYGETKPCVEAIDVFKLLYPRGMKVARKNLERFIKIKKGWQLHDTNIECWDGEPDVVMLLKERRDWVMWFIENGSSPQLEEQVSEYAMDVQTDPDYCFDSLSNDIWDWICDMDEDRFIEAACQIIRRM